MAHPDAPELDDFDVTITSTSDSEPVVRAALLGKHLPADATAEDADALEAGDDALEADDDAPDDRPTPAKGMSDTEQRRLATESGAEYEAPEDGESGKQRTSRMSRNNGRIMQLSTKVRERDGHITALRDDNRDLRARLDALERGATSESTPPVEPPAPDAADKFAFPTRDDWFETHAEASNEDYENEKLDAHYLYRKRLENQREIRSIRQREQEQILADKSTRIEAFRDLTPDYDDVINHSKAPMSPTTGIYLNESENGPLLAYHLSLPENLSEAKRIAGLRPMAQAGALARLESTLEGAVAPNTTRRSRAERTADDEPAQVEDAIFRPASTRRSQAPAPARRVPGSARASRNLEDLSTDEYLFEADQRDVRAGKRRG